MNKFLFPQEEEEAIDADSAVINDDEHTPVFLAGMYGSLFTIACLLTAVVAVYGVMRLFDAFCERSYPIAESLPVDNSNNEDRLDPETRQQILRQLLGKMQFQYDEKESNEQPESSTLSQPSTFDDNEGGDIEMGKTSVAAIALDACTLESSDDDRKLTPDEQDAVQAKEGGVFEPLALPAAVTNTSAEEPHRCTITPTETAEMATVPQDSLALDNDSQRGDNLVAPLAQPNLLLCSCCIICMETYATGDALVHSHHSCPHVFHMLCMEQWFLSKQQQELKCPLCQTAWVQQEEWQATADQVMREKKQDDDDGK